MNWWAWWTEVKLSWLTQNACCQRMHAIFSHVLPPPPQNWERGKMGQDRLEVRWEVVMFFFNVVNLNVWLFLFDNFAKCVIEVVVIMFGLDEGRFCWGCFACYVFMLMFNVSSFPLMFFRWGFWGYFFLNVHRFLFPVWICDKTVRIWINVELYADILHLGEDWSNERRTIH